MIGKLVTGMPELLDVMRWRRDQLNVSHETLDELAGLPSGLTGKILAMEPIRGVGFGSLGPLMGALGLALVVFEDSEASARMRQRWVPRKRKWRPAPKMPGNPGCVASDRPLPQAARMQKGCADVRKT